MLVHKNKHMWKITTTIWIILFWTIKIFKLKFVSYRIDNGKKYSNVICPKNITPIVNVIIMVL
jgi:hypothetical protein